jgi:hypothetical protein
MDLHIWSTTWVLEFHPLVHWWLLFYLGSTWGCFTWLVDWPEFYLIRASDFIGLAYQGKDIVFRFIIEYSCLRDFGPSVEGLLLYEDFWKMIFWLVLKLEISCRVIISWRILVLLEVFWRLYFCVVKYFEFP